jgi:hypothetical protein
MKQLNINKMRRVFLLLIIFLFNGFLIAFGQKAASDKIHVLFVGNSYTYVGNMPQIVSLLTESKHLPVITRKSVVGGAYLKDHWEGNKGLKTKEMITNGKFDYVVLQDQSQSTLEVPDTTLKYINLFCKFIRQTKAEPLLYETWAKERIPQQQATILDIYTKAAIENHVKLIPVGEAWDLARKLRPSIQLFGPDGSHPANLGVYLTSCMFFSAITGQSPEKLINDIYTTDKDGEMLYLLWVDEEDAVFIQKIVAEVLLKVKKN